MDQDVIEKKANEMIRDSAMEMENAKRTLQELANEVAAMFEIVQPALEKQIAALRSARMTTVTEIRESLTALRDIRKFFLEDSYTTEMDRLERFTKLCRELQALKADGVLDAVADTIIKLST